MNRKSVWAAASSPDRRLLLALLASLILHGAWLAQRIRISTGTIRPRINARLVLSRPAPPEQSRQAPRQAGTVAEPRSRSSGTRAAEPVVASADEDAARPAPAVSAVRSAPADAQVSGRDLAADALASVGSVSRDMSRQEGRLNPLRGTSPKEEAVKVRSAIADALEKQFGHPVHFVEESVGKGSDGSMTYYVRTEKGVSCFKTLPVNVLLSAPGQGTKGAMMFPTPC